MTSIFGLPAHPFFAHIPVVLIPLGALGAVAMLWPAARDRIGWVVVGIVFVAGISTQLAVSSGQSLREYVQRSPLVRAHTHIGENIRPWVLLMFLALVAVMLIARRRAREHDDGAAPGAGRRDWLRVGAAGAITLSIVFAGVATYWIYRIGHSGSRAVWATTQTKIDKGIRARERDGGVGR